MAKKIPAKKTSASSAKPLQKKASKAVVKPTPAKKPVAHAKAKTAAKKPVTKPVVTKSPAKTKQTAPLKAKSQKATPAPSRQLKKAAVEPAAKASKAQKAKTTPVSNAPARVLAQKFVRKPAARNNNLSPFLLKQRQRLLELKDTLLDSMRGVARDNLHAGSETSAFGMHQADAGSDAYDRDFALSMLSKEQGSLYEIDEALKRIDDGTYGVCDICEKPIRHDRLEALPFTRYTVECQAELEKRQHHHSVRPHINSLFGLTEEEVENEEEEIQDNS